jgi:hypothetical protein
MLCSYKRRTQIREEHKLRMLENRTMRMYRLKREEVTEGLTNLRDEEHHKLYFSPNIICEVTSKWARWEGLVSRVENGIISKSYSL